jgi:hypothetical protein
MQDSCVKYAREENADKHCLHERMDRDSMAGFTSRVGGRSVRRKLLAAVAFFVVLFNGCLPIMYWSAFRPGGSTTLLSFAFVWMLLSLLAVFLLPFALLLMLWRRVRRHAVAMAAILFLQLAAFMAATLASEGIRDRSLSELCERARPLVRTLHVYEQRTGRAPESLDVLVPGYIEEIPKIGLGEEYRLVAGDEARMRWNGRRWALTLGVPSVWPFPETLVYLPDRRYEETVGGLRLRRLIGDWGLYAWD